MQADDAAHRFAVLWESLRDCLAVHEAVLISALIGISTVFFTILINHGVRLRRIKLIHHFTSTFSPERRAEFSDDPSATTANVDQKQKETPRFADIRESTSLEFVISKYITDLDEVLSADEFYRLWRFVRGGHRGVDPGDRHMPRSVPIEYMLHSATCFSMPVNRRMFFYAFPSIFVIAAGWYLVLQALQVVAPQFWIHPTQVNSTSCYSYLVPIAIVFFSSYVASLKILIRAVCLFDLTSVTFLRVVLQIVGCVLAGYVIWVCIHGDTNCESPSPFVYILLFVVGFVPDGGINTLLSHAGTAAQRPVTAKGLFQKVGDFFANIMQFVKLTDGRFARVAKSIPLDAIDGIDFFTRYRLEEAGIFEVQNLATANPILLHVETPFGFYQVIDWVGQAQLCTVVGLERFLIFRQFNIRTVFDLERSVLSLKATSEIRRIIGGILMMPTSQLTEIENLCQGGARFPDLTAGNQSTPPCHEQPKASAQTPSGEKVATSIASDDVRASPPVGADKRDADAQPPVQADASHVAAEASDASAEEARAKAPELPDDDAKEGTPAGTPPPRKYLSAADYCRWAAAQSIRSSSYRVTLPNILKEGAKPPEATSYRVYPIQAPANLKPYARFEIIEGEHREVLQIYEATNDPDATIKHAVRLIMDDLHVMRLRQIWEAVARLLGPDAATLDDSEDTFLGA